MRFGWRVSRLLFAGGVLAIVGWATAASAQEHGCFARWKLSTVRTVNNVEINGLGGSSADDVWAVGDTGFGPTYALVLHWDGHRWMRIKTPPLHSYEVTLDQVVALTQNDAWAVGSYDAGDTNYKALILHWDGHSWARTGPTVDLGSGAHSISMDSPTDVWIGGMTHVIHWNGTSWSITRLPHIRSSFTSEGITTDGGWTGILALAPDDVLASGNVVNAGDGQPVLAHWDGYHWLQLATHNLKGGLGGLAGTSPSDIWAFGSALYHFNGKTWTPTYPPMSDFGVDISVINPHEAWFVSPLQTWNGSKWRRIKVRGFKFDGMNSKMQAILALPSGDVFVGGWSTVTLHPLFLHRTCV
jgi:hypothetical protein